MEEFFKKTVINLAEESKCSSFKVGAILVKDNRIISTGYNGTISKTKHCKDYCHTTDTHHDWSIKNELHAEQNAIIMAAKHGISINGCSCYTSLQPCNVCLLMLLQCGIKEIVYLTEYPRSDYSDEIKKYMVDHNIIFRKFS